MGPIACVAPGGSVDGSDDQDRTHVSSAPNTAAVKRPTPAKRWDQSLGDDIVTLFPRRKAGQTRPGGGRGPVVLTLELLEQFYGMPLHVAAKRLGICQTAIKKVCRRLGIKKWPYKEMRQPLGKDETGSCPGSPNSEDGATLMNVDSVCQDDTKPLRQEETKTMEFAGGPKDIASFARRASGDDVDFAVLALLSLQGHGLTA